MINMWWKYENGFVNTFIISSVDGDDSQLLCLQGTQKPNEQHCQCAWQELSSMQTTAVKGKSITAYS